MGSIKFQIPPNRFPQMEFEIHHMFGSKGSQFRKCCNCHCNSYLSLARKNFFLKKQLVECFMVSAPVMCKMWSLQFKFFSVSHKFSYEALEFWLTGCQIWRHWLWRTTYELISTTKLDPLSLNPSLSFGMFVSVQ